MMNTKKREFGLIIIFLFLAISIQAAVLRGSVTDKPQSGKAARRLRFRLR